MTFDLSDYTTVAERIKEAREKYPDHRFRSTVIPVQPNYVAVKAEFFRTPDDPCPAVGLAWEPVPGLTPYTKGSELQNAETSAWGRALIAAGVADASKGIASADEVANRRADSGAPSRSGSSRTVTDDSGDYACPACGSRVWDNRKTAKGKQPLWKCSNKDECDPDGKGWPWASWEEDPYDAGVLGDTPIREDYAAEVDLQAVGLVKSLDDYGPDEAPF